MTAHLTIKLFDPDFLEPVTPDVSARIGSPQTPV